MVEDDGIAKFPDCQTEEQPERERGNFRRGKFFIASELQFQQADFQRERLLHVGVQQPLCLLQRPQIFQRLAR